MTDYQFNPEIEVWKAIPDFPGYEVSDHGGVRSYWKRVGLGNGGGVKMVLDTMPQTVFQAKPGQNGYPRVRLRKDGKSHEFPVHRLVLSAFVGPCPFKMQACHNDGNPQNNYLINLRWDTPINNQHDSFIHGTRVHGERYWSAKLTESDVIKIRELASQGFFYSTLSKMFAVTSVNISSIVRRKTWTHI